MNSVPDDAESAKRAQMHAFLRVLWPEDQERGHLGIWTLPKSQCRWFPVSEASIQSAIDHTLSVPFEQDVYFHVASHNPTLVRKGGRGRIETAVDVPCIWADADFFKAECTKVYPTREQLDRALAAIRLKPSIIVFTGGGYHVYWLLHEPVEATHRTKRVCKLWQEYLKLTHGKAMDSTADAARILRLPGSRNHKRRTTVQVIEFNSDRRYALEEFEDVLEELGISDAPSNAFSTTNYNGSETVVQNTVLVLANGIDPDWTFEQFAADAIQRTLPRGAGEHYDRMWEFVRLLASHPQYAEQSNSTLRQVVYEWHQRALPYIENKDPKESWRLFHSGMRDLKYPAGSGLRDAMHYAPGHVTEPVIELCRKHRLRSKKFPPVVVLCIRLQHIRGDQPFFLSSYHLASWLGVKPPTGWGYLSRLVKYGLLEKVSTGRKVEGKSNEYKWKGPSANELGISNR